MDDTKLTDSYRAPTAEPVTNPEPHERAPRRRLRLDEGETEVLASLARAARYLAVVLFAIAVLTLLPALLVSLSTIGGQMPRGMSMLALPMVLGCGTSFWLGMLLHGGARAMSRALAEEPVDRTKLFDGLNSLRSYFGVQCLLIVFSVLVMGLLTIATQSSTTERPQAPTHPAASPSY
jgi:hypothetical protein